MGDLQLPEELLAVLPNDPYAQLDIARKITSMAISARVTKLEEETGKLRQTLGEKDSAIHDMQQHVVELEQSLQETMDRLSGALDEQAKLTSEKDLLAETVKKLNRDVAKLETFKKTLMQSLREEDDASSQKDESIRNQTLKSSEQALDDGSGTASSNTASRQSRFISMQSAADLASASATPEEDPHVENDVKPRSTQLTPTGSPKRQSAAGSPLQTNTSGSPLWHSLSDARMSLPSSLSTIQHTTAPNSPPQAGSLPARTPRVDGKEFFRQARTRLSYGQFSAFLAIIKDLNAHRQTREETLRKADEIFGQENRDLYTAFDGLLGHHLPAKKL